MITEETKIQNTTLPKSIKNILSRCNIFTVKDLLKDKDRLMRIRGIGFGNYGYIIRFVNDNGFNFDN